MINKVYKKIKPIYRFIRIFLLSIQVKLLRIKFERLIFLLGTPEHNNVGDLAITRAEISFMKNYLDNMGHIIIPFWILDGGIDFLKKIINVNDNIAGHGGGNMGDTYLYEEEMRRNYISIFPENNIIIMPQTIYFSKTKSGNTEQGKTQKTYSSHKSLTLIAREEVSYSIMKKLFPGNTVLLTPDIVLSSRNCDFSKNRSGAMICIRSDIESILDNNKKMLIAKILLKKYSNITYTDTVERGSLYRIKPNRLIVMKKLNQFRHKKIVVTDRLHGMVFSAITGTPCIALTNFNHKVLGTYKWIRKLGYIKFINSTDELESAIELLDTSKRYTYDPSVFNIYWQHISLALGAEKQ